MEIQHAEVNRAAQELALALGKVDLAAQHAKAGGFLGKAALLRHLLRRLAEIQFDLECSVRDGGRP